MWHLKYTDGQHLKFGSWAECRPVYARDFLIIDDCWQDGKKQTFAEQMADIGIAVGAAES